MREFDSPAVFQWFSILLFLFISFPVQALTIQQEEMLSLAYEYGETIQAIILVESSAIPGQIGDNGTAFGLAQVTIPAALHAIEYYNLPVDTERLSTKLITDHQFNLYIASYYFKYLMERFGNWRKAVVAYNVGPSGVENIKDINDFIYLKKICHRIITVVRPFNENRLLNFFNLYC